MLFRSILSVSELKVPIDLIAMVELVAVVFPKTIPFGKPAGYKNVNTGSMGKYVIVPVKNYVTSYCTIS